MLKLDFKKDKNFLFYLFLFSFFIRVLFFIFFVKDNPIVWRFDSQVYREVAEQIVSGNGISNTDDTPHFYRVPGYSMFLALTSFGRSFNYSLWIQIFLASFVPLLIFYLSKTLFRKEKLLPYIASIFSAIHLGFVLFAGLAMSESLFLIFFLLFLIFFYPSSPEASTRFGLKPQFFISGLFLGLASMFRPVGHYLIFVSVVLIFFLYKNKMKRARLKSRGFARNLVDCVRHSLWRRLEAAFIRSLSRRSNKKRRRRLKSTVFCEDG